MYESYKKNENFPQKLDCNEAYLVGNQIKLFLKDIYICDSNKIIYLDDNKTYKWIDIEEEVKKYEKEELKNV